MRRVGFLSFGHWQPVPGSRTQTAQDALRQTVELAVAAEVAATHRAERAEQQRIAHRPGQRRSGGLGDGRTVVLVDERELLGVLRGCVVSAGLTGQVAQDAFNEFALLLGVALVVKTIESELQLVVLREEGRSADERVTKRREQPVGVGGFDN